MIILWSELLLKATQDVGKQFGFTNGHWFRKYVAIYVKITTYVLWNVADFEKMQSKSCIHILIFVTDLLNEPTFLEFFQYVKSLFHMLFVTMASDDQYLTNKEDLLNSVKVCVVFNSFYLFISYLALLNFFISCCSAPTVCCVRDESQTFWLLFFIFF